MVCTAQAGWGAFLNVSPNFHICHQNNFLTPLLFCLLPLSQSLSLHLPFMLPNEMLLLQTCQTLLFGAVNLMSPQLALFSLKSGHGDAA